METTKNVEMTKDEIIVELMELLRQNNMRKEENDTFELCSYIDGLEKKLDQMTMELSNVKKQLSDMQGDSVIDNLKTSVKEAADRVENRCIEIKEQIDIVKDNIREKASEIVASAKVKGKVALNKIYSCFNFKEKLISIRKNVRWSQFEVNNTIERIDSFGAGMREANQMIANSLRRLKGNQTVDYSEIEKKFYKTELIKQPWKAKKKILEGMELRLDGAIDKIENMSRDVEINKMMRLYDNLMDKPHGEQVEVKVAEDECRYGAEKFEKNELLNDNGIISKENIKHSDCSKGR